MATFALLHGAWHDLSCWDRVTEALEARGHTVTAPELPLHDPAATYEERIRPVLDALDGAEEPLVVVGHSQSSSLAALVAAARPVSLVVHLRPMGMPPDDYPQREHPDLPTALIYAANDEFFEPEFERFVAHEVLSIDPIEIPGGHFAMAEDPRALAELLDRLAAG